MMRSAREWSYAALLSLTSFTIPGVAALADDVQIIPGAWGWPDQGVGLQPEGDADEGALVYDLLPYDGKLVVAGGFYYAGGMPAEYLAVWDGKSWSTLGSEFPNNSVKTLLELDGALYIGGIFNFIGELPIDRCAKWDGQVWSELGEGLPPTISVRDMEAWDDGNGSILFVAGQTVFRWDGTAWSIPGGGLAGGGGGAFALGTFDDGTGSALYVTGSFDYAGGLPCNNVAKWDGDKWSPVGEGITEPAGYGMALATFDDGSGPALYLGGYFTAIGGKAINSVARWDGKTWFAVGDPKLGPGTIVEELRVLDDGTGPALFLVTGVNLQKWDGKEWTGYSLPDGVCYTATVFSGAGDPALHVGGGIGLGEGDDEKHTNIARFQRGFACGDFNRDGITDQQDLGILLAAYNCSGGKGCPGDADGDGDVDQSDLGILLKHFGQKCG